LPKLFYLEGYKDYPLIVSQNLRRDFKEFLEKLGFKVLPLSPGFYEIEKLIYVPTPHLGCARSVSTVERLHRMILDVYKPQEWERKINVFINRNQAKTRKVNLEELLKYTDFFEIFCEYLTLEEQVNIFYNTQIVVFPHGAGGTNILFCRPGTKVLELCPTHKTYRNFEHTQDFEYIAGALNLNFFRFAGAGKNPTTDGNDFYFVEFDINNYRKFLQEKLAYKFDTFRERVEYSFEKLLSVYVSQVLKHKGLKDSSLITVASFPPARKEPEIVREFRQMGFKVLQIGKGDSPLLKGAYDFRGHSLMFYRELLKKAKITLFFSYHPLILKLCNDFPIILVKSAFINGFEQNKYFLFYKSTVPQEINISNFYTGSYKR